MRVFSIFLPVALILLPSCLGFLASRSLSWAGTSASSVAKDLPSARFATLETTQAIVESEQINTIDVYSKKRIKSIKTAEDYFKILSEKRDNLVVIKFHARWCSACNMINEDFKHIVNSFPDFNFYEVELEQSKKLCRELGITVLPSLHFYDGSNGKVEDFACGPRKWENVVAKLEDYSAKNF
mmetsp:Transcript_25477/g.33276  ORF Transcript_25477/g.33276 Transcript_25477/m.33276 type:complete len:183 (-) Transcript_25477:233-781(-)|eukprot:CAMPEP_0117756654 /NCGR_PEP_ID=MMETSP0947-20121206/14219_1 /TAXON_ID=44440 /ORGANISM="Chattonella subsalsa, Strain CCMP2191" /LENGTH=182 /DNA_ID=CAMNT_0005576307 /DNA_START=79 /DNA_END=627 /DNA_ORIENTATION=-